VSESQNGDETLAPAAIFAVGNGRGEMLEACLVKHPVVFVIFNRPDLTRTVFAEIARAAPPQLFVIGDGPRNDRPDDAALVQECREIVRAVTWPCTVRTNFSHRNLGCGLRISTGLDWVFSQVESAIVLEDECVPAPEFFRFCDETLDLFRDDTRIGVICGFNFLAHRIATPWSYYFSQYHHFWGWATWRRVWRLYDYQMSSFPFALANGLLADRFDRPEVSDAFSEWFKHTFQRRIDTWDYQFLYSMIMNSMLSVMPARNLVTNVGYGRADATHTTFERELASLPSGGLDFPLQPPPFVASSKRVEMLEEKYVYGIGIA
jgi:hypothetical protein